MADMNNSTKLLTKSGFKKVRISTKSRIVVEVWGGSHAFQQRADKSFQSPRACVAKIRYGVQIVKLIIKYLSTI